jgi:hypothetical protein
MVASDGLCGRTARDGRMPLERSPTHHPHESRSTTCRDISRLSRPTDPLFEGANAAGQARVLRAVLRRRFLRLARLDRADAAKESDSWTNRGTRPLSSPPCSRASRRRRFDFGFPSQANINQIPRLHLRAPVGVLPVGQSIPHRLATRSFEGLDRARGLYRTDRSKEEARPVSTEVWKTRIDLSAPAAVFRSESAVSRTETDQMDRLRA